MKGAFVEAGALVEGNDASLARNVEDQWTLMKEQILFLRDRLETIRSSKSSNRTPWLKSRDMRARQMQHTAYQQLILISLPSMCTKPRACHSHALCGCPGGNTKRASRPW